VASPPRIGVVAASVLVVVALVAGLLAYEQVPEGHEGVVKEFGAVTGETRDSGAQIVVPIQQSIQNVETRPRTYTMSATAGEGNKQSPDAITVKTVNGSSVDIDVTIRYRIDPRRADTFVETWNDERQLERRLIRPTVRSVLRDEASSLQTTGDDAIYKQTSRQRLSEVTRSALREALSDQPVLLEAVQIRNVNLPDGIDQALDQKEEAKQRVQVEQERIAQERARAEQRRVQAEAEADVIRIEGESLRRNPIVLRERYVEALQGGSVFVVGSGGAGETPIILDAGAGATAGATANGTSTPDAPSTATPTAATNETANETTA
jgi:regulator of protease activity HflC (stomatin/prohibitin superfamily)